MKRKSYRNQNAQEKAVQEETNSKESDEKSTTDLLKELRESIFAIPTPLLDLVNALEHRVRNLEQEKIGWEVRFENLSVIHDSEADPLPLEEVDRLLADNDISNIRDLKDLFENCYKVCDEYTKLSPCEREKIPQWLRRELDVMTGEEKVPVIC